MGQLYLQVPLGILTQCCDTSLFTTSPRLKTVLLTPRVSLSFSQTSCWVPNGIQADQPLQQRSITRSKGVWNGSLGEWDGGIQNRYRRQVSVLRIPATGRRKRLLLPHPYEDFGHPILGKGPTCPTRAATHLTQLGGENPTSQTVPPQGAPEAVI